MREKKIKKEWRDELIALFGKMKSSDKLDAFLKDLLTESEYRDVIIRVQIVKLLSQNKTHRYISRQLGVGVATVERGVKELNDPQGSFYKIFKKTK